MYKFCTIYVQIMCHGNFYINGSCSDTAYLRQFNVNYKFLFSTPTLVKFIIFLFAREEAALWNRSSSEATALRIFRKTLNPLVIFQMATKDLVSDLTQYLHFKSMNLYVTELFLECLPISSEAGIPGEARGWQHC